MKTKYWCMLLLLVVLLSLIALFFPGRDTDTIEVRCDGLVIARLSLADEGEYTITTGYGINVLSIHDGTVTVVEADCPGGDCTRMSLTPGGSIVCLPHHLVISYAENGDLDGISG